MHITHSAYLNTPSLNDASVPYSVLQVRVCGAIASRYYTSDLSIEDPTRTSAAVSVPWLCDTATAAAIGTLCAIIRPGMDESPRRWSIFVRLDAIHHIRMCTARHDARKCVHNARTVQRVALHRRHTKLLFRQLEVFSSDRPCSECQGKLSKAVITRHFTSSVYL
ncbi:hypothetical protein BO71DRAFT_222093 [Aspergillus ellipticus CBS 707.79]|uniref:Uncharacterized protein n=1 Tax=Aspergillus ellipticus CBS 707.79 TaxID=1448320 RepID=A0A319DSD5_9EURO|nr:hypothetical protein BO71DRAFT_222093 [Aspergillus ellipticus CBS 707.79]